MTRFRVQVLGVWGLGVLRRRRGWRGARRVEVFEKVSKVKTMGP